MCDSNYNFCECRAYGKKSDSAIFKVSPFYKSIIDLSLNIPLADYIAGIDEPLSYVLVPGISENILKPYSDKCLTKNKRFFNYRLRRATRCIECLFGLLQILKVIKLMAVTLITN